MTLALIIGVFLVGFGHLVIKRYRRGLLFINLVIATGLLNLFLGFPWYVSFLLALPVWVASMVDLYRTLRTLESSSSLEKF